MKNKAFFYGPYIVMLAAFLWSIDGFLRTKLYTISPVQISVIEHLLGTLLILPFFWPHRHEVKKLNRKDWMAVLFIACIASPVALILYVYALTQINFANYSVVQLLQQTQPVWAIGLAGLLLGEKLTKRFFLLAAAAMVSIYLLVFPNLQPNFETGQGTALAGLLALGAAAAWGSATTFGRFVLDKVSFATMAFLRFSLATVFSLILFTIFVVVQNSLGVEKILNANHSFETLFTLSHEQWTSLFTIVFLTGATAMLVYYYGLRKTPARIATICELVFPASSIVIGVFVFKNTFTPTQIAGIVILIASVLAISLSQKEKDTIVPKKEL